MEMNSVVRAQANGGDLAPVPAKGKALAVINQPLIAILDQLRVLDAVYREVMTPNDKSTYLGCERGLERKFLDRARDLRELRLPCAAEVKAALDALFPIVAFHDAEVISHGDALKMLTICFGALQKKKIDETTAILLSACADMFDPVSDIIGRSTGLWQPINKHPVVIALAIKRLIATSTFAPAPTELREAIRLATDKLGERVGRAQTWLHDLTKAERIVFAFDREAWAGALVTRDCLKGGRAISLIEEPIDNKDERRETERMAALDAIEKQLLLGQAAPARIAACEAKQAKLTHKPKREKGGGDE